MPIRERLQSVSLVAAGFISAAALAATGISAATISEQRHDHEQSRKVHDLAIAMSAMVLTRNNAVQQRPDPSWTEMPGMFNISNDIAYHARGVGNKSGWVGAAFIGPQQRGSYQPHDVLTTALELRNDRASEVANYAIDFANYGRPQGQPEDVWSMDVMVSSDGSWSTFKRGCYGALPRCKMTDQEFADAAGQASEQFYAALRDDIIVPASVPVKLTS